MTRKRIAILAVVVALALGFGSYSYVRAASLTATINVSLDSTLTNTLDLTTATSPLVRNFIQTFSNGTGANAANVIWSDERTLTTGVTEDLDFAAGGLTDAFGVAVAPAKIRAIMIQHVSGTVNLTLFGDAASIPFLNTAATTQTLLPGGMYVYTAPAAAGVAVTATTGDIIQIANGAGTTVYRIIVIGTTA